MVRIFGGSALVFGLRSKNLLSALMSSALGFALLGQSSCIDMVQEPVEFPLLLAGTPQTQITLPGGQIELSSAQVAFGPLYLCAGASAGDLCEVSRAQWLDTAVIDILDPTPRLAGQVVGNSGPVLSWMYDLGISSQLTASKPFVLPAAQRLGGRSLLLKGRARVEGLDIPFSAAVAVQQTEDTELGTPVVRKSVSDRFFRELGAQPDALLVRFDPAALFLTSNLKSLVQREQCAPQSAELVCDGTLARSCKDGVEIAQIDCAAQGQVCAKGTGCVPELELDENSELYRVLRSAMLSGARPVMEWTSAPAKLRWNRE